MTIFNICLVWTNGSPTSAHRHRETIEEVIADIDDWIEFDIDGDREPLMAVIAPLGKPPLVRHYPAVHGFF